MLFLMILTAPGTALAAVVHMVLSMHTKLVVVVVVEWWWLCDLFQTLHSA